MGFPIDSLRLTAEQTEPSETKNYMSEKYQVAVIGSGSGGSEAALLAAEKGFQVIIIEKDAFGGTRFHRGCYAVRALHASSRLYRQITQDRKLGIEADLLRSSLVDRMKA